VKIRGGDKFHQAHKKMSGEDIKQVLLCEYWLKNYY